MLEILGESNGEYSNEFLVECKKCGEETKNEFISDSFVLRFKATCEKCGESREFRFNSTQWQRQPRPERADEPSD